MKAGLRARLFFARAVTSVTTDSRIDAQISRMFDPEKHHRKSIRIPGYDYSRPGAYYITVCTHRREHLFGDVVDGIMRLNEFGRHVQQCWDQIPNHFFHVRLDEFIIMPNHIHGVIWITDDYGRNGIVGANNYLPLPELHRSELFPMGHGTAKTVGSIIRGFKIGVTMRLHSGRPATPVWQRGYHEHVIRNDYSLHRIRRYIRNNPMKWHMNHPVPFDPPES